MTVHSDIKTALIGVVAAAAILAAAFVSVAPARSEPLHRISATGFSGTAGPGRYDEWRARCIASKNCQAKVAFRFGSPHARRTSARTLEVQCDGRMRFARCEASGIATLRGSVGIGRWS